MFKTTLSVEFDISTFLMGVRYGYHNTYYAWDASRLVHVYAYQRRRCISFRLPRPFGCRATITYFNVLFFRVSENRGQI